MTAVVLAALTFWTRNRLDVPSPGSSPAPLPRLSVSLFSIGRFSVVAARSIPSVLAKWARAGSV